MTKQFKINKLKYRDRCTAPWMPQSGCQTKVSCIIGSLNQIDVNWLKIGSLQKEFTLRKLAWATNFALRTIEGKLFLPFANEVPTSHRMPRATSPWG